MELEHALSCPCGGFRTIRHNEIRDLLADLLTEVCPNVCTEPRLQPLSDERLDHATASTEYNARADIQAGGFWGSSQFETALFDVRVFSLNRIVLVPQCLPATVDTSERRGCTTSGFDRWMGPPSARSSSLRPGALLQLQQCF